MKKLMIAAAIVCAACFAQAAQINWSAYMIYDQTGTSVLQTDPGLYLAKVTTSGLSIVSDVGAFDYDKGENYTGSYYTLVGGKDADGDKFVIVDAQKNQITSLAGDPVEYTLSGFGSLTEYDVTAKIAGFDVENVKVGAVPEPTSGLLLLLGVAGLALKRRRA